MIAYMILKHYNPKVTTFIHYILFLSQDHSLSYRVMIEDVGALVDSQKRTQTPKDPRRLDYYRTLEEVRLRVLMG